MNEAPEDAIEEYHELRAEIRHYLERRQNTRNFAYVLSLAVLGSDFVVDSAIPAPIFVVPPLLLLSLWADEVRRLTAIQRLGTYLRVVVEPLVPGLQYETLGLRPERKVAPGTRILANADYPILFLSLSGLSAWKFYMTGPAGLGWTVLIALLAVVAAGFLFTSGLIRARAGEREEEERWLLARDNSLKQIAE